MRLQKGTSLALYSVLEFAANPGRQLSAAEIAEKYGASTHHLAKVLRELGRAGLVESARGVGGGYRFSGNAKRLTMMDVIELFEDISTHTGESNEFDTSSEVGPAPGAGVGAGAPPRDRATADRRGGSARARRAPRPRAPPPALPRA